MSDWPSSIGKQIIEDGGADTANSRGITMAPGGSANTKGSWVELIASTSKMSTGLMLYVGWYSGGSGDFLVDIAIGAGGSEVVIVSDILFSVVSDRATAYYIPVRIPSGSRVAARYQSSNASNTALRVLVQLLADNAFIESGGIGRLETLGANTANSGGVSIDPGASANTKGSWTEVGMFAQPARGILVVFGNGANTARSSATWLVDIAIGTAGSELVKIPNIFLAVSGVGDNILPASIFFPIKLAAVRVAARAQCSLTDTEDRLVDISIYGVR